MNDDFKILRIGVLDAIHNTIPQTAQDTDSMFVVKQIFEAPYGAPCGSMDIEPCLFEDQLEDLGNLRYRARLLDNILFSDGTPLTADLVADCLNAAPIINEQASVQALGDHIEFALKRPNARFDLCLSHGQCSIYKRQGAELLGTGPFVPHPESISTAIRLVRNPHHRPLALLDEVHFKTFPLDHTGHPNALLEALENGEVGLTNTLTGDDINDLTGVRKFFQRGNSTAFLYLNTESPRLGDPRVRRAIAHAIDRLELAKTCYTNALAFSADGFLPRNLGTAEDDLGFDLERARALLAEPGVVVPQQIDLLLTWGPRPYLPQPQAVSRLLVEQIGRLGIQVDIVPTSSSADFFDKIIAGANDLMLSGWVADTMDPVDFLESNIASYRVPTHENLTVSANSGRLRDTEMDRLLNHFRGYRDEDSLLSIVRLLNEQAPLVPLIYGASATVLSFNTKNFRNSPLAHYPLTAIDVEG
jgi:ABC-type transport system substrate-binding protein